MNTNDDLLLGMTGVTDSNLQFDEFAALRGQGEKEFGSLLFDHGDIVNHSLVISM
jgi:hypothetical protein